jgi:predicted RecA/RadA family phage recombinase
MKNYVQPGDVLPVTAPYAIASGDGVLIGALFGVATADAAEADTVEVHITGVLDLAKTSGQAWTAGAKVYWDGTNKVCTSTATDNTLVGVAVAAAANPSAVGRVRLNGSF